MDVAGRFLAAGLVVYLVAVAPLHGRRYERLRVRLAADPSARLRIYRRTPVRAALLCSAVAAIGLRSRRSSRRPGASCPPWWCTC